MPELNYEQDIEIDAEALDVECLRQATLFYKYSKIEAEAKRVHGQAWEESKLVRSRLIKEGGADKSLSNAAKMEAFYRSHPDHIEAKQNLIEAEYELNMATAAVRAMQQRKYMLENLTRLALADYFARPSEPRDIRKEVESAEEKTKAAGERASTKIRSRRKRTAK